MPVIACLGVNAVELAHASGEIGIRCGNDKMIMVVHQAVSETDPTHLLCNLAKDFQELLPIRFIFKYCFLPVATRSY